MRRFILLLLAMSGLLVCGETVAQAPMKNGLATVRERSYILTAKKVYKQQLSVNEARMIAQAEDKLMAQSKDKTKKVRLLGDYLRWRQSKQKAESDAKTANDATRRPMDGGLHGVSWDQCPACHGNGRCGFCRGNGCDRCQRSGSCPACNGSGWVRSKVQSF